jgi:hypothetical protein
MVSMKTFALAVVLCPAFRELLILCRIVTALLRARRNLIDVLHSERDPRQISMFAEAQMATMRLDLRYAYTSAFLLMVVLSVAGVIYFT